MSGCFVTVDHGNTRTKVAVFKDGKLTSKKVFTPLVQSDFEAFLRKHTPDWAILSSVKQCPAWLKKDLRSTSRLLVLSHLTPLPFKNNYRSKRTLGMDRLAGAAGAWKLFPGKNVLVLDAGTCLKVDFMDKSGRYHGGSIAPGLTMRYEALHDFTGKLPLVSDGPVRDFIGRDTQSSIRTGVVTAMVLEMEGYVKLYRNKFGPVKVILTGGDAPRFVRHLNFSIFAAPDLVAIGLNEILSNYAALH